MLGVLVNVSALANDKICCAGTSVDTKLGTFTNFVGAVLVVSRYNIFRFRIGQPIKQNGKIVLLLLLIGALFVN